MTTTSRAARFVACFVAASFVWPGASADTVAAPAQVAQVRQPVLGVAVLEHGFGDPDGPDRWKVVDGRVSIELPDTFTDLTGSSSPRPYAFQLLGEVAAGYVLRSSVLADRSDPRAQTFGLHLLDRDGTATTFWQSPVTVPKVGPYPEALLSDTGSKVYVHFLAGESPQSRIIGLDGTVEEMPGWIDPEALDFPGPDRLLLVDHRTTPTFDGQRIVLRDLSTGESTVVRRGHWPRTRVSVGDLGADVFALEHDRRYRTTFYRFSEPRRPLWSAEFVAVTLNPSGTLVAGHRPSDGELQIRRVRDGRLLNPRPPGRGAWTGVWEDDKHLLLANDDSLVWRCNTSGRCRDLFIAEAGIALPPPR